MGDYDAKRVIDKYREMKSRLTNISYNNESAKIQFASQNRNQSRKAAATASTSTLEEGDVDEYALPNYDSDDGLLHKSGKAKR